MGFFSHCPISVSADKHTARNRKWFVTLAEKINSFLSKHLITLAMTSKQQTSALLLKCLNLTSQRISLTKAKLDMFPDEYILFFWTQSALFTIDQSSISNPQDSSYDFGKYADDPNPLIRDQAGELAGSVCKMAPEHWDSCKNDSGPKEFIVVGRR